MDAGGVVAAVVVAGEAAAGGEGHEDGQEEEFSPLHGPASPLVIPAIALGRDKW